MHWNRDHSKATPDNIARTDVAEVLHGYHILFSLDRTRRDHGESDVSTSVRKAVARGR